MQSGALYFLAACILCHTTSARTCICAAFTAEECDQVMNCKFNYNIATQGEIQGSHGVCRSLQWYKCHVDPMCSITYRDPTIEWDQVRNDMLPDSSDDMDWPWDCEQGTYSAAMLNVKPLQSATMDLYSYGAAKQEQTQSFVLNTYSNDSTKLAAEITCAILVIAFIACMCGILMVAKFTDCCLKSANAANSPLLSTV
mmetsp:Transcript_9490/g.15270  ORF Transcript_9490/g.15270 Transcript_9490/m.15270 type:complete len:198 (+) Transcript_9490:78-671(+)